MSQFNALGLVALPVALETENLDALASFTERQGDTRKNAGTPYRCMATL
ncbi:MULTISPECIES: hypothetical protein [unclassified Bradyrhizobium]|nr:MULTISPECIES: hypothetical protein [unclassified Bradyrhizobium]